MMIKLFIGSIVFCLWGLGAEAQAWSSPYVKEAGNGTLIYAADEKGNRIPDFSRVGYRQGALPLPSVPVVKTLEASGANSGAVIQQAVDELAAQPAGKNGYRGAILLKKGVYPVAGTIQVSASGIVLRGEGDDTRLVATGKGQRNLINVTGAGRLQEVAGSRRPVTTPYVPVGATSFEVEHTKGLSVGSTIIVYRPATAAWIHDLKMDQIEVRDSGTRQWAPEEYDLHFERQVTRIENNRIFIDNPVVMAMDKEYGGGAVYVYEFAGRISEVGVENLACESAYGSPGDEDHGWNAVFFNRVENGWVRHVTARYFGYSCVNLGGQAKYITVDSCRFLEPRSQVTGGRRYSFNNDGQLNLFMNCFATEGRHDYVTGARVCGPNVFYNCRAQNARADIGPHHRWSAGTLYDNIVTDGEINVQDRGNWGTGHGWAGVTQVVWNCTAAGAAVQNPWVSGANYIIGFKGKKLVGRLPGRPDGVWEGLDKSGLHPASLFRAQRAAAGLLVP